MSYIKNVQAFGKLTGICTGYGGQYNPGKQNLQVNALVALFNNAQHVLTEVNETQTSYDNITNTRELGFKGVLKLSSRIFSVLKSCGAHALTQDDARLSTRKIRGDRFQKVQPAPDANAAEVKSKPGFFYARDFASLAFYFAKLVETVSAEPKYKATEPELSVEGLKSKVAELQSLNAAVTQAEIQLASARRKRKDLFYAGEDSLYETATAARQYVRGAFGFASGQREEVSRLHFTKTND